MSSSRTIAPLPSGRPRPFWSVMIPTYNCADYLRHTLAERARAGAAAAMTCRSRSSTMHPSRTIRRRWYARSGTAGCRSSGSRPTSVRRPTSRPVRSAPAGNGSISSMATTWSARGSMRRCVAAPRGDPGIHAAFCRVITIDEHNGWIDCRSVRRHTPASCRICIDRLAVCNLIMFPSIVVKRSAYEQLGGFHPELFHSADWDMWKRIAARLSRVVRPGAAGAVPDPSLVGYLAADADGRQHPRCAPRHRDSRGYLPPGRVGLLSRKARLYHALYAMELARERALRGEWAPADGATAGRAELLGFAARVGGGTRPHSQGARRLGGSGERRVNRMAMAPDEDARWRRRPPEYASGVGHAADRQPHDHGGPGADCAFDDPQRRRKVAARGRRGRRGRSDGRFPPRPSVRPRRRQRRPAGTARAQDHQGPSASQPPAWPGGRTRRRPVAPAATRSAASWAAAGGRTVGGATLDVRRRPSTVRTSSRFSNSTLPS